MDKIKIGYPWDFYYYKRTILSKVDDAEYVKVTDLYKLSSLVAYALTKMKLPKSNDLLSDYKFSYNDFFSGKVDLLHFFNSVSFGKTPWITTFETYIPRYPMKQKKWILRGLKAISSENCKKIIAISECTVKNQERLLRHFPEFREKVAKKITVIHPPQKLLIGNFDEKKIKLDDAISFIFVGHDFFRKGGLEILHVFNKLRNSKKLPIKLTIISRLNTNDHASHAGRNEYNYTVNNLKQNEEWITYYHSLPNADVLKLLKESHVGLLPTWADTYGFSVLEMQASGCPVITTDVRALPEINDNTKGWLINVPKDDVGEAFYKNESDRERLSHTIEVELEKIVLEILKNPYQIREKCEKSISNIKTNHSPEEYSKKLKTIYMDIVSK